MVEQDRSIQYARELSIELRKLGKEYIEYFAVMAPSSRIPRDFTQAYDNIRNEFTVKKLIEARPDQAFSEIGRRLFEGKFSNDFDAGYATMYGCTIATIKRYGELYDLGRPQDEAERVKLVYEAETFAGTTAMMERQKLTVLEKLASKIKKPKEPTTPEEISRIRREIEIYFARPSSHERITAIANSHQFFPQHE